MPLDTQWRLITGDGEVIGLGSLNGNPSVASIGNTGAPPLQWITTRGYRQDGQTVQAFTVDSRVMSLTLVGEALSGAAIFDRRAKLLQWFNPYRGVMTLEMTLADGRKRALKVRPSPGPVFPPYEPSGGMWTLSEPIELIAHSPFAYDPVLTTVNMGSAQPAPNLVFAITFPISFGSAVNFTSGAFVYGAQDVPTVPVRPKIVLTGPYTSATITITNALGAGRIIMYKSIGVGQTRTIDLAQDAMTVVDQAGTNVWGDVAPASDVTAWQIANGSNTITAAFGGGTLAQTNISITYNTQYTGF